MVFYTQYVLLTEKYLVFTESDSFHSRVFYSSFLSIGNLALGSDKNVVSFPFSYGGVFFARNIVLVNSVWWKY